MIFQTVSSLTWFFTSLDFKPQKQSSRGKHEEAKQLNIIELVVGLVFAMLVAVPAGLVLHTTASAIYPPLKLMSKRRQIMIVTVLIFIAWQIILLARR